MILYSMITVHGIQIIKHKENKVNIKQLYVFHFDQIKLDGYDSNVSNFKNSNNQNNLEWIILAIN
jgi:hypothetical protein